MACNRFQTDGMKLLDGEMKSTEKQAYEEHVKGCADCTNELRDLGRVVGFTNEMRLRAPDEDFWAGYWRKVSSGLRKSSAGVPKNTRIMSRGSRFMAAIPGE